MDVKLERCRIKNAPPEEFCKQVIALPQLGYEVEDLSDGRKIVLTKPGGKSVNDIMVWVYEGPGGTHWRPSHGQIKKDLQLKLSYHKDNGLAIIEALEKVYEGVEPDDILSADPLLARNLPGLPVDLILKAYKWIWAQEDMNYPPPRFEGRAMSMRGIRELKE
ncbi:MAG: hypothetical protein ISS54_00775 [Dehalococcoidia bacterium]|nr:hypothetical protein [Dehalococcoidia bacterium]